MVDGVMRDDGLVVILQVEALELGVNLTRRHEKLKRVLAGD